MMSRLEVMAKLQTVFQDVFDDDDIVLTPETTSSDIPAWDSLNQIKIIIASERAFGIRLKPREINALENVDEMVDHLCKAIDKQRRG
jgi:acyl carrier protein